MNIKKIELEQEKSIVTNMIVNDDFLKIISDAYKPELFKNNFSKIIASWCMLYYSKYEKAPKKYIEEIFTAESKNLNSELSEIVSTYLQNLSEEFEEKEHINIDYEIDKSNRYFRIRKLENLKSDLENALLQEKVEEAEAFVSKFKRIETVQTAGINVISKEAVNRIYDNQDNSLFKFPGALGKLLGGFNKADLISVAAPAKRGKTWYLQEIAILSMMNKYKTLFISLEMTEEQMLKRIYQRMLGVSVNEKDTIRMPKFAEDNSIIYYDKKINNIYDLDLNKKMKSFKNSFGDKNFKLICVPIRSIKASDIHSILDNLEYYEKFIPDVLIIDYADILAPENNKDRRNQIDETWIQLRNIAHEKHNLVITGTHSNKATFKKNIGQGDISEDIRKLNHVAMMFGLNQAKDDKKNGIMRVTMLAGRHSEFVIDNEVIVLYNLNIGRPYIDSRFRKDTKIKGSEYE